MTTSKRKKKLRKLTDALHQDIPGRVLNWHETKLSVLADVDTCGYLRQPHLYEGEFYGKCALQDFEMCDYPCHLPRLGHGKYVDFKCPTYKHFMHKQNK